MENPWEHPRQPILTQHNFSSGMFMGSKVKRRESSKLGGRGVREMFFYFAVRGHAGLFLLLG